MWYYNAVISLCEKGIISGYDDSTFRPNQNITRAEFAAIASQFIFDGDITPSAKDVERNAWYAEALSKMINSGYISGYEDGTIRPDRYITRGEVKTIVDKMIKK